MFRVSPIVRITAKEALRIICKEKALVKLIASPIINKSDANKDEHWHFLLKQLKKPHRFRPVHPYPNHDRDRKFNLLTKKWEQRQGKNNKPYLLSPFKKDLKIRPKQGAQFTKKTSTTLYLTNIALYTVKGGHELGIVFNSMQCHIKAGQIWLENAFTYKRWMFAANNKLTEKEFISLRTKHKPTSLNRIRSIKQRKKHNEILARVRDPIAVFTPVYDAKSPIRRLNLITKKYLVKMWLHRDVPMLIMTTSSKHLPHEYPLTRQIDDVKIALIAAKRGSPIFNDLIDDIFNVKILDTEENTADSYCTFLKALIANDPNFFNLRMVPASFWHGLLMFAIKHQDIKLAISLLSSDVIEEIQQHTTIFSAIIDPDRKLLNALLASHTIKNKYKHTSALLALLVKPASTIANLIPGVQADTDIPLFVNIVGFFEENGADHLEKATLISALITFANLAKNLNTNALCNLLNRPKMRHISFDGHPGLLLFAIERCDDALIDLLLERDGMQVDESKLMLALIDRINNNKSKVVLDFLNHKKIRQMKFQLRPLFILTAMEAGWEAELIHELCKRNSSSPRETIANDTELSAALKEFINNDKIATVIHFLQSNVAETLPYNTLEAALSAAILKNSIKLVQLLILQIVALHYGWSQKACLKALRFIIQIGHVGLAMKLSPVTLQLFGNNHHQTGLDIALDLLEKSDNSQDKEKYVMMIKYFLTVMDLSHSDYIKTFTTLVKKDCGDHVYGILKNIKRNLHFNNCPTFMFLVINKKKEALAQLLIERGMDVNLKLNRMSLIEHALYNQCDVLSDALLCHPTFDFTNLPAVILVGATKNRTAFTLRAISMSRDKKITFNCQRSDLTGNTALHMAVQHGNKQLIKKICNSEDVSIQIKNKATPPLSPLDLALTLLEQSTTSVPQDQELKEKYTDIIQLLLIKTRNKPLSQEKYQAVFLKLIELDCCKEVTAILQAIPQPSVYFYDDAFIKEPATEQETAVSIAIRRYEDAALGNQKETKEEYALIIKLLLLHAKNINPSEYRKAIEKLRRYDHVALAQTIEDTINETLVKTKFFINNMNSVKALRLYAENLQKEFDEMRRPTERAKQGQEKARKIFALFATVNEATSYKDIKKAFSNDQLKQELNNHRDYKWLPASLRPATDSAKLFSRSRYHLATQAKPKQIKNLSWAL